MSHHIYSIGIDPGKSTGFAVYHIQEEKLVRLETLSFWSAFGQTLIYEPDNVSRVVIELPDSKHVWHKDANGTAAIQRQAVNVGSVLREAELLAMGIENAGYNVQTTNPRGKVDAKRFKMITGWTGQSNQHERDAGLLCFGR